MRTQRLEEPANHWVWWMRNELGVKLAEAHAHVAGYGGSSVAERTARSIGDVARMFDAKRVEAGLVHARAYEPRKEAAAVFAELEKKRPQVFVLGRIATHWDFLAANGIKRSDVSEVSYGEWVAFDANPFVLLRHGVKLEALMRRPCSPEARRYGAVLALLLNSRYSICVPDEIAEAEIRQHAPGLAAEDDLDLLDFDPSGGRLRDHPMYRASRPGADARAVEEADPFETGAALETFSAAQARVEAVGGALGFGQFMEFNNLSNGIVHARGAYWRAERFGADERCAAWVARKIWNDADDAERDRLIQASVELNY